MDDGWFEQWLRPVARGTSTMSQRRLKSVEDHGGIALAVEAAERLHLHLVELTDEHGRQILAASPYPFKVHC